MWVNTESRSIPLDGEFRDNWDLERDMEEPRDNMLPVKRKIKFFYSLRQHFISTIEENIYYLCTLYYFPKLSLAR